MTRDPSDRPPTSNYGINHLYTHTYVYSFRAMQVLNVSVFAAEPSGDKIRASIDNLST